ncbi:hypothetical protein FE257_009044 [Aspergillus nanangensis]|uniref:Decapping enzyme Dcp1 n=1 Tax=Aspergillus nanangensis TaxID=2582783 RepID=A0AAD4GYM1_ASPNN|nr:hypothetical protein FE257_009044 [Aspergillus nanangensis]
MTSRKPRRQNNNYHNHNNNRQNITQPLDYESDYQTYFSDMQQQQQQQQPASMPSKQPERSSQELNLSVLRRHNPAVNSILSIAPYAVIYKFSPSTRSWEKCGIEGSLFICQLTQGDLGEERYSAFVLNRRGLRNFDVPLTDGDNVELTEEYIILKTDYDLNINSGNPNDNITNPNQSTSATDISIYGIWIYSEPPPNSTAEMRTLNAQVIRECAVHAGNSLQIARERLEAAQQNGMHMAAAAAATTAAPVEEMQQSVPMGRQISLKDLFGQQRAQDDGWSVRAHHMSQQPAQPPVQPQQVPSYPGLDPWAEQFQNQLNMMRQNGTYDALADQYRRGGPYA